ncbi:venom factor-like [Ruditapes philippinarum]|uniref:venom factor-like n=1 Tax=Ruditapes philippinarum TaxID=129788 RepID=UPI00295BB7E3|nr:venom factor-like [Ruditapes philippinarum]
MESLKLCLLVGSIFASCESAKDYYFVTAPNVIRFNHHETVLANIFGNGKNIKVSVWLEHRGTIFSLQTLTVPNEKNPVNTTVRVTESDIFDTVIEGKPRFIHLCSRRGVEHEICNEIVISYKTGYLIVQTDKPIYTPLQKVKIRVLALDESLKRVSGNQWQITMDIVSPSNLTLGRRVFTNTKSSGFYQNAFSLPPYPEIGTWTARAFYGGQYETVARSFFQIEEYVLPTFGVTIDVSQPYILLNQSKESKIDITVIAKYVYGKPVAGKARLSLNVTHESGENKYLLDMNRKDLEQGIAEFSIKIGDNFGSEEEKKELFPDGSRLLVIATVFESATGKEESTFNDATVFARQLYIFKFTRSKRYFRPGMKYFAKVDVYTPDGAPATGAKITVERIAKDGSFIESKEEDLNSDGKALAIFSTSDSNPLRFKVIGPRSAPRQESEVFEVMAYEDKNQIRVEMVTTDDDKMLMNAYSNLQLNKVGPSYTGMLFVIVTRGKIVRVVFKKPGLEVSEQIDEALQELINPTARLLVFYVEELTDKVVVDSIKIDVDAKCRGSGLSLKPQQYTLIPGSTDKLTVTGTPFSWVGLNAMDKALLLLNDKNVLMKNQMFDALRSHDLGCGEGSGKNNGDVFKNAGLSILTNAIIDPDMYRSEEGCEENSRKKRAAENCNGANERCCVYGTWYAEKVFNDTEKDERAKLDSYTLCYSAAKKAFETNNYAIKCILSILHSCTDEMETLISKITQLSSRSLEDVSYYANDLKYLAEKGVRPHKRTDFRESFLFEEVQLDTNGQTSKEYGYPDSITEWRIQAIGITENMGLCIADPVDVTVFRKFFIQLDLPYKATRFELFDVKATLFNYGLATDKLKHANMYLEAVEGLCYGTAPGKPSPRKEIEVSPNSATTVRFPMIPLKAGKFSVKITAIVTDMGIPDVDIIEKDLYVVNEGIQEIITIQVCLDPKKQSEDCEDDDRVQTSIKYSNTEYAEQTSSVDLSLPNKAIQGTGSATAYLQANVMDNVVQNILSGAESLFQCPHGCGEQTIGTTAPNVYAMMYLKQTNQVTAAFEVIGDTNIRYGVNREKSLFRHSDGSYSCCNNDIYTRYYRATSVWLTAFVAKVFCHANTVIDDLLDVRIDIYPTLDFLKNHMNRNGEFREIQDTNNGAWLKGATKAGSTPSLTAFVLISLLECNYMQSSLHHTIGLATNYLEGLDKTWLRNRPFDLAITTYALALANSKHTLTFKNLLVSIEKSRGKKIYWARQVNTAVDAYAVETTAYALLAMLKLNDIAKAGHIVRWLTSQQDARGVFKSTQDTVVGLQALSQYSIRTFSPDVDLKVAFTANDWHGYELSVKNERFKLQKIGDKLPVERGDSKLGLLVTGKSGSGRMRIELRYNRPAEDDEICPFDISDIDVGDVYKLPNDRNIAKLGDCDVCGKCNANPAVPDYDLLTTEAPVDVNISSNLGRKKRQAQAADIVENMKCIRFNVRALPGNQHGMSMIYFNLETGVTVIKEDMQNIMRDNDNIDDFEMPTNGNGLVVFYLNRLTSHRNDFLFRLEDNFEGDKQSRQPVSVDVFDYYDPDKYCRKIYGTGPSKGVAIDYKCDSKNEQCRCLKSACSVSVDNEILNMMRKGRKPAVKLLQYTCNPNKANFADIVKVKDVWDDPNSKNIRALTEVTAGIHPGSVEHKQGDELVLYWKSSCPFPKLEKGKQYLVIAKDGFRAQNAAGDDEYLYSAMGSTLLIESKGKIKLVINAYRRWMERKGCLNK